VIGLVIDFAYLTFSPKEFGSYLHIGLLGILIFLPFVAFEENKICVFKCFLLAIVNAVFVYLPVFLIQYSQKYFALILFFIIGASFISCKKVRKKNCGE